MLGRTLDNSTNMATTIRKCYPALAHSEAAIKADVLMSPVCHFDETGLRVDGRLQRQHVASTAKTTDLVVHPKRRHQALDRAASLFPAYQGAVHDCWRRYFQVSTCRHALCKTHLLRELTALSEHGSRWAKQMQTFLLTRYQVSDRGTRPVGPPTGSGPLSGHLCVGPPRRTAASAPTSERETLADKRPKFRRPSGEVPRCRVGFCLPCGGPLDE